MTDAHQPDGFVRRGVTIDGHESRDLDDAVWARRYRGGWLVAVYVADVASAVPEGGDADLRARTQAETLYRASGDRPMLPRHLAEGLLSLLPGQERRAVAVDVTLDDAFRVASLDGRPAVSLSLCALRSENRYSYAEVAASASAAAGLPSHPDHGLMARLCVVAKGLLARRRGDGAIAAYDVGRMLATDEEGVLRRLRPQDCNVGHLVVRELMILANRAVAGWCLERDIPVPYRNHVAHAAAPSREDLLRDIDGVGGTDDARMASLCERTQMLLGRATYGAELRGHFGLALPAYLHFTSPIRRYADVVVHRQVVAALRGEPPPYDRAAVESIAAGLNATLLARREAASQAHRDRADQEAARATAAAALLHAAPHVFERAVKVEARGGGAPSPELADAFVRRAAEGRVPEVCFTVVVTQAPFDESWKPLRAAVVEALARAPEGAVSLLAQAPFIEPDWTQPVYEAARGGPPHVPFFDVTASLVGDDGDRVTSGPVRASTKKAATQRAALALVAVVCGVPIPAAAAESRATPAPAPRPERASKPRPVLDPSRDPVSLLHEWCAWSGHIPVYDDGPTEGPPHAPTLTVVCLVGPARGVGRAGTKAAAKKLAAAAVLAELSGGDYRSEA